jgi:hypothetical protein
LIVVKACEWAYTEVVDTSVTRQTIIDTAFALRLRLLLRPARR